MYKRLTNEELKALPSLGLGNPKYELAERAVTEIRELRSALENLVWQIEHEDGAIECGHAHEALGDKETDDD